MWYDMISYKSEMCIEVFIRRAGLIYGYMDLVNIISIVLLLKTVIPLKLELKNKAILCVKNNIVCLAK